uniref:C3H1-type domain-containing protein n=1 Tax=Bionectria ochroleuca TaxID=29856 RepID=A0A8H7TW14_BIOOC
MFRGNSKRNGNGVCREFRRDGVCRYGVRCKFPHGPQTGDGRQSGSSQAQADRQRSGTGQRQSNQDVRWREWKQILTASASSFSRPSEDVARRFFSLALDLMSGDQGASQETIKALADDQGLKFIRDLADRHILKLRRTNLASASG